MTRSAVGRRRLRRRVDGDKDTPIRTRRDSGQKLERDSRGRKEGRSETAKEKIGEEKKKEEIETEGKKNRKER